MTVTKMELCDGVTPSDIETLYSSLSLFLSNPK